MTSEAIPEYYAKHGASCFGRVPRLDQPCPPLTEFHYEGGVTLSKLSLEYTEEYQSIRSKVREALAMEDDAELDENDDTLVMRAWRAHNEKLIARLVRYIAGRCPCLDEFDWWLQQWSDKVDMADQLCHVCWHWKIKRNATRNPVAVLGTLAWERHEPGCTPLPMAVGSELQYALKSRRAGRESL